MSSQNNHINIAKQAAAKAAIPFINNDSIVGIGSGSTVYFFIEELGKKVREGFQCKGVATSEKSSLLAIQNGIEIIDLNDASIIDITVDGADEIDNNLQLIKGGGGALLREKMVAAASSQLLIIADETKQKKELGTFPLPVEVVQYGWKQVYKKINQQFSINLQLRMNNDKPFITDNGNYILDCNFISIIDPASLNILLHLIPGVVETGLFTNMASQAIIGFANGTTLELHKKVN